MDMGSLERLLKLCGLAQAQGVVTSKMSKVKGSRINQQFLSSTKLSYMQFVHVLCRTAENTGESIAETIYRFLAKKQFSVKDIHAIPEEFCAPPFNPTTIKLKYVFKKYIKHFQMSPNFFEFSRMRRSTWNRIITDLEFFPQFLLPADIDNIFEVCSTENGVYSEIHKRGNEKECKKCQFMNYIQFVEGLRLVAICYLRKNSEGYFDWKDVETVLERYVLPRFIMIEFVDVKASVNGSSTSEVIVSQKC
eukprot:TRINITY_DN3124_c2_g1_i1.p1 TRINITY_DN3124_c2_g1~~TRINITY_DN3124_c2_g1_i1.p1  ORF type:complete len:249 (-),score=22.44 TRINITY_DN3124_c2_g1_i1:81-827(-)